MYNLLISLGISAVLACVIKFAAGVSIWAAILPAFFAFLITNIVLARRIGQKVQAIAAESQKELAAQHFDKGIKTLESAFKYAKWQLFMAPELHASVGGLYYAMKKPELARPHLEKAGIRGANSARAKAMLAALLFQEENYSKMKETFEKAIIANKKDVLIWAAYGWCLEKQGQHDEAISVFSRGSEANPSDEKLKNSLLALKNQKKLKMKPYGLEWYQMYLEKPPLDMVMGAQNGGRKVIFQRR